MAHPYQGRDKEGMKQERKAEKLSKSGPSGMNLKTWSNYASANSKVGKGGSGGSAVKPAGQRYPLSKSTGGQGSGGGRLAQTKKK